MSDWSIKTAVLHHGKPVFTACHEASEEEARKVMLELAELFQVDDGRDRIAATLPTLWDSSSRERDDG